MRVLQVLVFGWALALFGCGGGANSAPDSGTPDGSTGDSGVTIDYQLGQTLEAIPVEPGEESRGLCQSWSLNNEEPLYVKAIKQTNNGAWHHSNWFFVPEDSFEGPDGTWKCSDREWSEVTAAVLGGVFFAQSTQTELEEQIFPEGAVLEIPPHSKIAGDIHLVNISAAQLDSAITIDIATVPEEEAEVKLRPVSFSYGALDIPPADPEKGYSDSKFSMTCDFQALFDSKFGTTPDYSIYYVLGHYHANGNYFKLDFVDEEDNATNVMEINTQVGEPLGRTIFPLAASNGARYLRSTCGYRNFTDTNWKYGFAEGEMCVFLAYIDADIKIAGSTGGIAANEVVGVEEDGTVMNEAPCSVIGF